MKYRIGCSGYYYPQWKNKFYPKGVAPKNWLAHYSSVFNTVELNGTFYRQPKLPDLKKYASVTPDDFTFSVKMSRYITHVQRFADRQTIIDFQGRVLEGLGHKLQHFLFQTPANFKYSEENLQQIIANVPHTSQSVVEFRDISWWNESVLKAFTSASIVFCNVDFPKLESPIVSTSSHFYLRLHGSPVLFQTPYTIPRLKKFHRLFPADAQVITVYFNNTMTEAGFQNALQLMKIIS
ncbi:MAG TPA: DUF72 domain-containing protein [Cyclobacteriaceae bacterium]|nr:DUF72 domain-containing protein [Cyclobacteriaceae bacterium]